MKQQLYRKISSLIKNIMGIENFSLFKKKFQKRIGKIFYHKKYDANDIVNIMSDLGLTTGSLVCIHASMMQFYNYRGTANQLIDAILAKIGPTGTLMMPAFPKIPENTKYDDFIFNPISDKTGAGYLAETFRHYPNVLRSNNVRHSVCALGPLAEYLVKDHTNGQNCWDKKSPWYKLCEKDGLVFNFGLPREYVGTFHHCVESLLKDKHPYWSQFFTEATNYHYYENDKIIDYTNIDTTIYRKTRKKKVLSYFTENEWKISRISNLEIKVFYAKNALNKMLDLGMKGISVYQYPSTKNYHFE